MSRQPHATPRHTSRLAAGLLLTAVLGGCGSDGATPDPQAGAAAVSAPREGELLLASPPAGWVETAALATPALRMAEYGPPEEPEGTVERVTFEAQPGAPLPDPIEFVLAVSRDLHARCKRFQDTNVSSGYENGYPTSVRLMVCEAFQDSPHGQVVMAKAIQGEEQFYVITRRLQVPEVPPGELPLPRQAMAEWTTYLKHISLCDTRGDAHPCPPNALSLTQ